MSAIVVEAEAPPAEIVSVSDPSVVASAAIPTATTALPSTPIVA